MQYFVDHACPHSQVFSAECSPDSQLAGVASTGRNRGLLPSRAHQHPTTHDAAIASHTKERSLAHGQSLSSHFPPHRRSLAPSHPRFCVSRPLWHRASQFAFAIEGIRPTRHFTFFSETLLCRSASRDLLDGLPLRILFSFVLFQCPF